MKKTEIIFNILILGLAILTSCSTRMNVNYKYNGVYQTSDKGIELTFYNDKTKSLTIDIIPLITPSDFIRLRKEFVSATNEPQLSIKLNEEGTEKLRVATKENIGKRLAIILNDKLLYAPKVQVEIPTGEIYVAGVDENLIDELIKYFK